MQEARPGAVSEVVARRVDPLEGRLVELAAARPPMNCLHDITAAATGQQGEEPVAHPRFGFGVALAEESASRLPDVLNHMHHLEEDRPLHADPTGLGLDGRALLGLPVDEHDPAAAALRIATQRLL